MLKFTTNSRSPTLGFYLHGEIEKIIGYDLVNCNYCIPLGITDCNVNNYDCICYSWIRRPGQCGLICLKSDIDANEYALKMYNDKAEYL